MVVLCQNVINNAKTSDMKSHMRNEAFPVSKLNNSIFELKAV